MTPVKSTKNAPKAKSAIKSSKKTVASSQKPAAKSVQSKAKAEKKPKTALKAKKTAVLETLKMHEKDTGSAAVQIGIFTKRIEQLTQHLKTHTKDFHSRRGLIKMIAKRKRLLEYLRSKDIKTFKKVKEKLGLK